MRLIFLTIIFVFSVNSFAQQKGNVIYQSEDKKIALTKENLFGDNLYVVKYYKKTLTLLDFRDLDKVLKLIPKSNKYVVLELNTPGGSPSGAKAVINSFNNRDCSVSSGCETIALVKKNSECSSACLYIFSRSDYKITNPSAKFGFHAQRTFIGYNESGQALWTIDEGVAEKDLIDSGFSQSWINILVQQGVFRQAKFTYFSGNDLNHLKVLEDLYFENDFKISY